MSLFLNFPVNNCKPDANAGFTKVRKGFTVLEVQRQKTTERSLLRLPHTIKFLSPKVLER